ncbi:MAG: hypothetical protein COA73_06625 [Candidatus Hydrogenedentota bacterium]|nr:MAG: hypothetical protein COA73_06625 [Candidatus Hydrogenedentota bacterium]
MSDWCTKALGDIASINIGGTPSREIPKYWAVNSEDGEYWVSIADLKSRIIDESKEQITIRGVLNSNVKPVKSGTLIMSFKLSIGRAAIAGKNLYTNEAIAAIVPKNDQITSSYLYYILPPVAKNAITDTAVKGATLNKASLTKLSLTFPCCRARQNKITSILETIDLAIEKTEALIAKYQQIKAGLMHDLFTRGITADGKLRPPREQAPHLYKQTPIGWIPMEWKFTQLREVSNVVRGSTPRPAKDPRFFDGDHIPWITVGELSREDWPFLNETRTMLTEQGAAYSRVLETGTLVISNSGYGCGVPKILNLTGCANDGIAAFLDLHDNCNQLYIYYFLYSQIITLRTKVARGNDQPNLNTDMLGEFRIPLPAPDEQKGISERLWSVESMTRKEESNLEKLLLQKSGLMHDLLTGKVPVNVDEVETA